MINKIKELLWKRKYIFLFLGLFIIVLTQRFLNERQNGLINSVSSDGLGYYSYLPAAIIYQDFTYNFYQKTENKINPFYSLYLKPNSLNKYYCGTAFCFLPFFLTGIVISAIAGTEINGYTDTFLMLISIGALIYYLLSIFLISKIAKFFDISEKVSFVTCLVFFFGTNLFHYVIQEPSMSHAYSFFAVSLFLYLYTRLYEQVSAKKLIFFAMALGLIILIRPTNVIVVLFLPFFSENFKTFFAFVKSIFIKHTIGVVISLFVLFAVLFIQLGFFYLQTGTFYIVSYDNESFNFAKPEFFNILFSYKKGLFVYTPLLLAAILVVIFSKKNWYKKIIFLITFLVFLYITASWWCWWYGAGFSNRPFIDILPLFIITCFLLYNKFKPITKKIIFVLCFPFIFLNQVMAFQYSNLIMNPGELNEEQFWDIFLKTDLASINENKISRLLNTHQIIKTEMLGYQNDIGDDRIVDGGYKSDKACKVGKSNFYSKGFGFSLKDLHLNESFYIIVECMAKTSKEGKDLGLVISIDESPNIVKWDVVYRNQFDKVEDGWVKMTHLQEINVQYINDKTYMKIFANTEHGENLVDDLKYTIVKKDH